MIEIEAVFTYAQILQMKETLICFLIVRLPIKVLIPTSFLLFGASKKPPLFMWCEAV